MTRCPKCHACGEYIVLHEIWNGEILEFLQMKDGSIHPEGTILQKGDPVGVRGFCLSCAHRWKVRGVFQIIHVPGHPDYRKAS